MMILSLKSAVPGPVPGPSRSTDDTPGPSRSTDANATDWSRNLQNINSMWNLSQRLLDRHQINSMLC